MRAHGNSERFWIVQLFRTVNSDGKPAEEGRVYRRAAGEEKWEPVGLLSNDIVAMGSRLTQLAILEPDGQWSLVSDETITSGPALPNGAKVVTFGADGATLWAIGELTAAASPAATTTKLATTATSPATAPAIAAATAPAVASRPSTAPAATAPATPSYALFALQSQGWVRGLDLPPGAQGSPAMLSLSFVDHEPVVAWRSGVKSADASRLTDGNWWPAGQVTTAGPIARVKLVDGTPRPVLWVAAAGQEASLTWLGTGEPKHVVVPIDPQTMAEDSAVAFANGRVRVVGYVDRKLAERTYDPLTGAAASGPPVALILPKPPAEPTFSRWADPFIVVALIYVIVASVRRRDQMRDVAQQPIEFVLAPVPRRFLAGTIDALPVLVACGIAWWQYTKVNGLVIGDWKVVLDNMAPAQVALCLGGVGFYLLHTSLAEVFAGRSLGKACCGLRVVGLDGRQAAPSAVVTRNLLRIIDLGMFFFPLLLILFSPLRQRAGDVAAGTLVVLSGKAQPVEPDKAAHDEQSPGVTGRSSTRSDP